MSTSGKIGSVEAVTSSPLHEQVKDRIIDQIALGNWSAGHVLPAETDLARQLGVSYGTMRRAMADLSRDGLVMRRPRTGTVVTGRSPKHTIDRYYNHYRLHASDGALVNTQARILDVTHRPITPNEAISLKTDLTAIVGVIKRLRLFEGRPVMLDIITIPLARVPGLPDRVENMPTELFKWLLAEYGLRLAAARETLTARLASTEEISLLELSDRVPHAMLIIDEVAFDPSNQPLLMMHHAALTDAHCYVNEVR